MYIIFPSRETYTGKLCLSDEFKNHQHESILKEVQMNKTMNLKENTTLKLKDIETI